MLIRACVEVIPACGSTWFPPRCGPGYAAYAHLPELVKSISFTGKSCYALIVRYWQGDPKRSAMSGASGADAAIRSMGLR